MARRVGTEVPTLRIERVFVPVAFRLPFVLYTCSLVRQATERKTPNPNHAGFRGSSPEWVGSRAGVLGEDGRPCSRGTRGRRRGWQHQLSTGSARLAGK